MELLLATAIRAAEAAAAVHRAHFGGVGVEGAREKARSDFVTQVDLEAQAAALEMIRAAFPSHHILAEEEPDGARIRGSARSWPESGEYLWIVDPLDGTTNYLHRHPMFCASVAVGRGSRGQGLPEGNPGLAMSGTLEAAAVVAPRTRERWWAGRGEGAWKNGKRIRVSEVRDFSRALVGTGFPFKEPDIVPRFAEQLKRVLPASGGVRRCGSAALDLCYLAEGILDGFWEEDYLSPWDTAAGLLILSESGGMASRMDGSPMDLRNGSILAGNSRELVAELAALLRECG